MTSPRQLLIVMSIVLVVVGVQTWRYPPDFLALAWLWCSLAVLAGVACAAAAVNPRRLYVAFSGAAVVTCSTARGLALCIEWAHAATDREAGFIVGALTWWLVALLGYITWREYVLPWAIARRRDEVRL